MRLSPESWARERPQRQPMESDPPVYTADQPELPNIPPPLTENRARDFGYNIHPPCKRCQRQCDFCLDFMADHKPA